MGEKNNRIKNPVTLSTCKKSSTTSAGRSHKAEKHPKTKLSDPKSTTKVKLGDVREWGRNSLLEALKFTGKLPNAMHNRFPGDMTLLTASNNSHLQVQDIILVLQWSNTTTTTSTVLLYSSGDNQMFNLFTQLLTNQLVQLCNIRMVLRGIPTPPGQGLTLLTLPPPSSLR